MYTVLRIPTEGIPATTETTLLALLPSVSTGVKIADDGGDDRRIIASVSKSRSWDDHLRAIQDVCSALSSKSLAVSLELDTQLNDDDFDGQPWMSVALDKKTLIAVAASCDFVVFSLYRKSSRFLSDSEPKG